MDPQVLSGIIGAAAALIGAVVGGVIGGIFTMKAATSAHARQLELQQAQFRAERELKARELMFSVYQRSSEQLNQDIKGLGGAVAQMMMVRNLPVDDQEKLRAFAGFIQAMGMTLGPIAGKLDDIESELRTTGLYNKHKERFEHVRAHLKPVAYAVSPAEMEHQADAMTNALAYITDIQNDLMQKKSLDLFSEYLPSVKSPGDKV